MIIFRGEPSGECRNLIRSYNKKSIGIFVGIAMVGFFLFLGIPAVIEIGWEILLLLLPILAGVWLFTVNFDKGLNSTPCEVCIDHESINVRYANKNEMYILIEKVGRVVDMGTYYKILDTNGKAMPLYSCQKNLLTEGTIEDFEKSLKGKLLETMKKCK